MKRPSPPLNSNRKVAALIGAIVFSFGICVWRISAASTAQPEAPDVASGAVSIGQGGKVVTAVDRSLIADSAPSTSVSIDPFRSVLILSGPRPSVVPAPEVLGSPDGVLVGPLPLNGALPAISSKVVLEPTLILKGVITGGPQGVAVLSVGGKDSLVEVGTVIATGYRVAQINDGSLTMRKGAASMVLLLQVPASRGARTLK